MNSEPRPFLTKTDPAPQQATAGAALVAQMRPALLKYFLRKCRNAAEAEDLTQDVLMRALAHADWQSIERAKGYVFRAAVNRWRDLKRRERAHGIEVGWDDAVGLAYSEEKTPERVLIVEQELQRIATALQELGERTRDVFVLIRLERMKQADIAAMFGISISAVEKHLAKALAHLARHAARMETPP